jgi:thiamine biosynthesis lipoprotein ApbE
MLNEAHKLSSMIKYFKVSKGTQITENNREISQIIDRLTGHPSSGSEVQYVTMTTEDCVIVIDNLSNRLNWYKS